MEFLYKDRFCTWFNNNVKRKTSNDKACNPYAEGIGKLLKSQRRIPDFEQDYTYYVPALLLRGERVLAKQLLACVYADACIFESAKSISYFKCYCKFIAKEFAKKEVNGPSVQLKDSKLKEIKAYLNNRQVWVLDKTMASYLKTIHKEKNLKERYTIRIEKWGRSYFPLDSIKAIFRKVNPLYIHKWKYDIRDNIKVVITPPNDYIPFKDVKAFIMKRKNAKDMFDVEVIDKKCNKNIVWTPLANGNFAEIKVTCMDNISIDHEIPLDSIVKGIINRGNSEIEKISNISSTDIKNELIDLHDVNIDKLMEEMEEIKKGTSYILMSRSENSRKSNKTSF